MSFPQWEEQQGAEVTEPTLRGSSWKTENHELQQHFRKYEGTANLSYNTDGSIRMLICACLPYPSKQHKHAKQRTASQMGFAGSLKYFWVVGRLLRYLR